MVLLAGCGAGAMSASLDADQDGWLVLDDQRRMDPGPDRFFFELDVANQNDDGLIAITQLGTQLADVAFEPIHKVGGAEALEHEGEEALADFLRADRAKLRCVSQDSQRSGA